MEEENNDHIGAHCWGGFTEAFLLCPDHEAETDKVSSLKKLKVLAESKTLKEIRETLSAISKTEQNYLNSPLLDEIFDTIGNITSSPIIHCATKNKKEALNFYLKRGDYSDNVQHAVCRASVHGHTDIIKILSKRYNIEKDEYFLKWAASGGRTETVSFFLGYFEYSTEEKNTALMYALKNEHLDTIKLLLESGADPRSLSTENVPPHLRVNSPLESSNAEIVELFMQHGISPFNDENSAIISAAMRGHTEVIKLFLENKYFPVNINIYHDAILRNAVDYNRVDLVEFLLENGADARSIDLTIFMYRNLNEKILESLITHGADIRVEDDALLIDVCSYYSDNAKYVKILLSHGANVKAQNNTALKQAFLKGKSDVVKLLLECGADINDLDAEVKNSYFYQEYLKTPSK